MAGGLEADLPDRLPCHVAAQVAAPEAWWKDAEILMLCHQLAVAQAAAGPGAAAAPGPAGAGVLRWWSGPGRGAGRGLMAVSAGLFAGQLCLPEGRSRVRWSIRDLRWDRSFFCEASLALTGHAGNSAVNSLSLKAARTGLPRGCRSEWWPLAIRPDRVKSWAGSTTHILPAGHASCASAGRASARAQIVGCRRCVRFRSLGGFRSLGDGSGRARGVLSSAECPLRRRRSGCPARRIRGVRGRTRWCGRLRRQ